MLSPRRRTDWVHMDFQEMFPMSVVFFCGLNTTHPFNRVLWLGVLVTGDTDSNGALDYAEVDECVCCAFTRDMLEQQLYHKAGCDEDCGHQPVDPPLRAKFNSMDQAGDGFLRFSVFYEHCRAGRFFSGLLKATDTEKVSKETDTGAQSVGSRSLNASGARRRTVESATKSPTHSGWQTEMEQQQELRRREWAETLEEAKRRSQDFARSAALAAQALEPSSPTSKQHTETTLGMALAAVDLLQYEAAMYAQGYVALDDLCDASAQVRLELCQFLIWRRLF